MMTFKIYSVATLKYETQYNRPPYASMVLFSTASVSHGQQQFKNIK